MKRNLVSFFLWLLCAQVLLAQSTTQQISGFVKDATGAVVPTAKVSVRHVATDQTRTTQTNESGYYVVANIPIGEYEVAAEAAGFKRSTQKNVVVVVNSKPAVDLVLEVGAVTESVTITADVAQIETSSGEVGRLISGQQATQLQLNGRNFAQLLGLIPGVSTTYASSFSSLFGGYGSNMSGQSANGSRNDTFSWNIDGVDNKDNGGGGNNFVNINPDAIAEFKVLTTNYSAEYGQNAGAIINLALKSGTMSFTARPMSTFATTPSTPAPLTPSPSRNSGSTISAGTWAAPSTFRASSTATGTSCSSSAAWSSSGCAKGPSIPGSCRPRPSGAGTSPVCPPRNGPRIRSPARSFRAG
jgi:hypothetical protein